MAKAISLEEKSREELLKIAAKAGLNPADSASNEDIIKSIRAAKAGSGGTDSNGETPPASGTGGSADTPGAAASTAQQDEAATGTPLADTGGDKPSSKKKGKKRMECVAAKGQKIRIGAVIVEIDENGFFEVEEKEVARLLTIPGYKEAGQAG